MTFHYSNVTKISNPLFELKNIVGVKDATANLDRVDQQKKKMGEDLAEAIKVEINRLAKAGCKYIQVDEPLFARLNYDENISSTYPTSIYSNVIRRF